MKLFDMVLALLASARMTRFVTTDWLGFWWLRGPAQDWALRRQNAKPLNRDRGYESWDDAMEDHHELWSKEIKLVKGLDCPYCVGFWIGAGVLLVLSLSRRHPRSLALARFGLGVFGLNYVAGHLNAKLDD